VCVCVCVVSFFSKKRFEGENATVSDKKHSGRPKLSANDKAKKKNAPGPDSFEEKEQTTTTEGNSDDEEDGALQTVRGVGQSNPKAGRLPGQQGTPLRENQTREETAVTRGG